MCLQVCARDRPFSMTLDQLPFELLSTILGFALEDNANGSLTTNHLRAQLRSVNRSWRQACDEHLETLTIRSWPSPCSSLAERFPNTYRVELREIRSLSGNGSSSPPVRRHTRSLGPLPSNSQQTTINMPQQAANQLLSSLSQLSKLSSVSIEQSWNGPVRGRAAQTFIAATVAGLINLTNLKEICLQGDGITGTLRSGSSSSTAQQRQLPNLHKLHVIGNRLRGSPIPLSAATALRELHTPCLPGIAAQLPSCASIAHLRSLDLKLCQLGELPSGLGDLTMLTQLDVSGNQLMALPPTIGKLTNLQYLDCSDNKLGSLPPSFTELSSLTWLSLSSNWQLSGAMLDAAVPRTMPDLKHLDLSATGISNLRMRAHMPALQTLLLSCNELTKVPDLVGSCRALQTLSLDHNDLTTLPEWLCSQLSVLTALDVSSNRLSSLPADIGDLSATLHTLHSASNALTTLPASLAQLPKLTDLDLQENQLGPELPGCIWKCSRLESLVLAGNGIKTLPDGCLLALRGLRWLDLAHNELSDMPWPASTPAAILPDLEVLKLKGNELPGEAWQYLCLIKVCAPRLTSCDLDEDLCENLGDRLAVDTALSDGAGPSGVNQQHVQYQVQQGAGSSSHGNSHA